MKSSNFNINEKFEDNIVISDGLTNHFYVGGGIITEIDDFEIEPSLLIMVSPPAPVSLEVMTRSLTRNFSGPLSYHLSDAFSFIWG